MGGGGGYRALMDRLQRKQRDIVADPLKVTAIPVCQVWHQLTQQGNTAYAMYRKLNRHHSARAAVYWFGSEITVIAQEEQITLFIPISKCIQLFVHQCGSASAFPTHFSRWTSHNGAFSSFFSLYLSSRCQVQWGSPWRWMPSDTVQNIDNKLQAALQAVHLRSSPCKLTTACTEAPKEKQMQRPQRWAESSNTHSLFWCTKQLALLLFYFAENHWLVYAALVKQRLQGLKRSKKHIHRFVIYSKY